MLEFDVHYTEDELNAFDQRSSLRPPQYRFGMHEQLKGLEVGDSLTGKLPMSMLACHGREQAELPEQKDPGWVDWGKVQRGQALWLKTMPQSFTCLGMALLSGFSIARFAEVLFHNGYAKDGMTAMQRYRSTMFYLSDFYRYPLDCPDSQARKSLAQVRLMHEFARRRSGTLFSRGNGEGIALSQLDMSEVQLGFTGICLVFMKRVLDVDFTDEETEDMTHAWRVIGYFLGIDDEFNVCSSVEKMRACTMDFMMFTRRRFQTARDSTNELRRTALEGFAMQTGLGQNFWLGMLGHVYEVGDMGDLKPQETSALPGLGAFASFAFALLRFSFILTPMRKQMLFERDEFKESKEKASRRIAIMTKLSTFHDAITWKIYSAIFMARYLLLAAFLFRIAKRLFRKERIKKQ